MFAHRFVCAVSCSLAVWLLVTLPSAQAAVGRTAGTASVSTTGSSMYSIPITLPPGINGLAPSLSFEYRHNAGNGLLGMGWSVSGFSAITRCNRTLAQDGVAYPVIRSTDDGLCLDGNRLRSTGGTHGLAGSTYQTELEVFSRVTAYGTAGVGPSSFIVESKDGLIYEYGNTDDSRIEIVGGGGTPRAWLVNRIRDRTGNVVDFVYAENTANGSYEPDEIRYGANPGLGIAHAARVDFVYETAQRPDPLAAYFSGDETISGQVIQVRRLDRISIEHNSALVRRYELSYEAVGGMGSRSRLSSIQDCDSGGDCLAATNFTWINGTPGLSPVIGTGQVVGSHHVIDINADGFDDLVWVSSSVIRYMLGSASGYSAVVDSGRTINSAGPLLALEWDGDGRMDLLNPVGGSNWSIYRANGNGFDAPVDTGAAYISPANNHVVADVDGDGRDDLVRADRPAGAAHSIRVRLRSGNGFSAELIAWTGTQGLVELDGTAPFHTAFGLRRAPVKRLDFDNDGRGDILVKRVVKGNPEIGSPDRRQYVLFMSSGSITAPTFVFGGGTLLTSTSVAEPAVGDFNGDGLQDIAYAANSTSDWRLRFNRGRGVGSEIVGPAISGYVNPCVLDWDGDGMDDLLLPISSNWYVARSTGQGLQAPINTGIPAGAVINAHVGDFNGDGLYDFAMLDSGGALGQWEVRLHAGSRADLLQNVTDGFNNSSTFSYAPITYNNYTKYSDASLPERDYQGPLYVVSQHTQSNGLGGTYNNTFWYYGARVHLQGRGFEGFYARRTLDSRDGVYTYEYFHRLFPYTGTVFESDVVQPNWTIISRTLHNWTTHVYNPGTQGRFLPFANQSTTSRYEVGGIYNGSLLNASTTTRSVDVSTGALNDSTTTVTEASTANGIQAGTQYTQRTYHGSLFNDFTNWCFGRPQATQVINSHTAPGGTQVTRNSSTTWDGVRCRPTQSVTEPGSTQWQVTTDYGYDNFGNINSVTVTPAAGQGQAARTTSISWGTTGRFPESVTNPKSQTTTFGWNGALGLRTSATDANNLTASFQYDGFGRITREQRPEGTATDYVLSACNAGNGYCGSRDLRSYIQIISRDTANVAIRTDFRYFDGFDRQRYEWQQMLSGGHSYVITFYDALGRVSSQSLPFASGEPTRYTSYTYDLLSRLTEVRRQTSETDTSDSVTQISYQGLRTVTTDPLNRSSTSIHSAIGQVVQTIDAANGDTDYEYDAFGNLLKTRDFHGNENILTYNVRGMKMSSNDPDMGYWTYDYYPLGEPKTQMDAKSQTVTFTYDALSRPLTRTEPEGTTTWIWDAATKGIGQLASVTAGPYSETVTYDSHGRRQTLNTIINGVVYTYTYGYHPTQGVLQTLQYPTNVGTPFKIKYEYQYGYVQNVTDFHSPNTIFWQANATNARHQVIDESFGNGLMTNSTYDRISGLLDRIDTGFYGGSGDQQLQYSWDKVGNLTKREDFNQGTLNETFEYDALDRLDIVRRNGVITLDMAYNAIGNITSKSDVGAYTYHATKKHAVVGTAGAINNSYDYDANGNMTSRNGQTTTWYSYNLPKRINYAGRYVDFLYGPNRQRYMQDHIVYPGNYATSRATIYVQGLYEVADGAIGDGDMYETFFRHYVVVDGRRVANHVRYRFYTPGYSHTTQWTAYATSDHLSSMDSIYDMEAVPPSTTPQARYSNDAFGKRRDRDWDGPPTQDDLTAAWFDFSNRGFTDHEHLDGVGGLIHMNGRVYDPAIGRFMSADPFIDWNAGSQGLNRFSYVGNKPLSFTDPSGFMETVVVTGSGGGGFSSFGFDWLGWFGPPVPYFPIFFDGIGDIPSTQGPNDDTEGDVIENVTVTGTRPQSPPLIDIPFNPFGLYAMLYMPSTEGETQSDPCSSALQTAGQNQAAINRALRSWATISSAAAANGIDPKLLAAIGVRETGFRNVWQTGGGMGAGVFQIDLGVHPNVTPAQAFNIPFAANYAASLLASNTAYIGAQFPSFTAPQLLQATAASYNFGVGNISGNPATIDLGSTHNNYGSNVVGLMKCFK